MQKRSRRITDVANSMLGLRRCIGAQDTSDKGLAQPCRTRDVRRVRILTQFPNRHVAPKPGYGEQVRWEHVTHPRTREQYRDHLRGLA
jgi:hypothetical protein